MAGRFQGMPLPDGRRAHGSFRAPGALQACAPHTPAEQHGIDVLAASDDWVADGAARGLARPHTAAAAPRQQYRVPFMLAPSSPNGGPGSCAGDHLLWVDACGCVPMCSVPLEESGAADDFRQPPLIAGRPLAGLHVGQVPTACKGARGGCRGPRPQQLGAIPGHLGRQGGRQVARRCHARILQQQQQQQQHLALSKCVDDRVRRNGGQWATHRWGLPRCRRCCRRRDADPLLPAGWRCGAP